MSERDLGALQASVEALLERMRRHESVADQSFAAIRDSQSEFSEALKRIELQLAAGAGGRSAVNYIAHGITILVSMTAALVAIFSPR